MKQAFPADKTKLILAMSIFGTIGIVRRCIPYPSSVISLVRAALGVLFLIGLQLYRREGLQTEHIRKNAPKLLISGILLGGNWILLFEAYRYTYVSVATMCYYMAPLIVMLASPLVFREYLGLKKRICAAAAIMGMFLVSGVLDTGLSGLHGILMGLGAAAMYACIVILNKQMADLQARERTLLQLGISALTLTPYVLLTENLTELSLAPEVLCLLALVGIVHTGLAYVLYFGSIGKLPAQTIALLSYLDPVLAVILSFVFLGEHLSPSAAVGVVLVLGAMFVSEFQLNISLN